jgi:uncharacterized membrane protein YqgA involved in biofilm formation
VGVGLVIGLGTAVNVVTILVGGGLGMTVGAKLPERITEIAMQAVGGVTLIIGLQMALGAKDGAQLMIVLLSLVIGSVLGEWWDIEGRMNKLGQRLEARFAGGGGASVAATSEPDTVDSRFVRGFMTASLLFCVGPMAVLGSLQDGLQGNASILITKSTLDGIASVAIAAALGPGTLLAALPILVYQGSITLLSGLARTLLTDTVVAAVTVCGGIMIVCIAVNMWKVCRLRVGNMLPALIISGVAAGVGAYWHLW